MAQYPLCLPPIRLAGLFRKSVQPLLERLLGNIHESRSLSALRDTLLRNFVTGRLRAQRAATLDRGAI